MQWAADALDTVIAALGQAFEKWWPSLLLVAVVPLLRRVRAPWPRAPQRAIAYAVIFVVAVAAGAARTCFEGEPHPPWFEDDFGYLLTADTFVHGHLAMPAHPMHRHFETMYQLQMPRYASAYPPGQGLLLAIGLIFGSPSFALWIATALAACAICWAVSAAAPFEIAFLAGLVCAVHPTLSSWAQTIHGGSLPAIGGALAIGAALRLVAGPRTIDALLLGSGIVLLATTRMYEGAVLAAIAVVVAAPAWRRLAPAAAVVLSGLLLVGVFNRAVTGSALELPYHAYNARFLSAPNFLWQRPIARHSYPNLEMSVAYARFERYFERSRSVRELPQMAIARIGDMFADAIPSTTDPQSPINGLRLFAAIPLLFAVRRQKFLVGALAVFALAILQITWWPQPHYVAPAAALFAIVYACGIARLFERGDSAVAWLVIAILFVISAAAYADAVVHPRVTHSTRLSVDASLGAKPGGHLVVADERCFGVVYNAAEIDAQKIVWARAAGNEREVADYYSGRSVWRLQCQPRELLTLVRPPIARSRAALTPDLFAPRIFPGRLRQSTR